MFGTKQRWGSAIWTVAALVLAGGRGGADEPPSLADILNPTRLGARSTGRMPRPATVRTVTVRPGAPLVQRFRTGAGEVRLVRVALWIAGWTESWTPEESLVLTVHEGGADGPVIGRCEEPYSRRHWEGAIHLFDVGAPVKPDSDYVFSLSVRGGDGTIDGVALSEGGEGLWFEVHVKREADLGALHEEAFARYDLDRPGLERVRAAVAAKDWPVARRELVRFYEHGAEFPRAPATPRSDPRPLDDHLLQDADLLIDGKWRTGEEIVDLGPRWSHYRAWRTRGGVGLTRTGVRGILATAYRRTRDERYAKAWDAYLRFFFHDMPSPLRSGAMPPDAVDANPAPPPGIAGGSMWASLSIGARMLHGFAYYAAFVRSPSFTEDARFAFIVNLGEMAEVLERMKGGGNWEAQNATALLEFGLRHPEFRRAREWVRRGFESATRSCLENTYSDGALREASIGYHNLSLNRYLQTLEKAERAGFVVDPEMRERVVKMLEYTMLSTMPDGFLPIWGDLNPPASGADLLLRGARLFGREDMRWVATRGRAGKPPRERSVAFPDSGYWVLRTGWSPDSTFVALHNGRSFSHGHNDSNSFVLASHGTQMVVDPGIYVYGTEEAKILTSTRSHSTVTPDGLETRNGAGPARFVGGRLFDLYDGVGAGYAGAPDARHRRRLLLVKRASGGPFVLLADSVADSLPRRWTSRVRLADGRMTLEGGQAVWENGSARLAIVVSGADQLRVEHGLASAGGERKSWLPVLSARARERSSAAIGMALLPGLPSDPPRSAVWRNADGARVVEVPGPGGATVATFDAAPASSLEGGSAALVGLEGAGPSRRVAWFAATGRSALTHGARPLFRASATVTRLEAWRDGVTLRVDVDGAIGRLELDPLGAARISLNGARPVPAPARAGLIAIHVAHGPEDAP